ncbi:MAG: hypothetical protein Q9190_003549 [Brigantiaea leucoxantha]
MQSYLQYRRFGAELHALQERGGEQFHRQHSCNLQDRVSLHRTLTSGHFKHAALGDQFYLPAPSSVGQLGHLEQKQSPNDSNITQLDAGGGFGPDLDGVEVRDGTTKEGRNNQVFVVHFVHNDPDNPQNWSVTSRVLCILQVAMIGFLTLTSSSIDAAVAPQAADALHVSEVAESLATAMWLIGSGIGSMIVGPFSETFGRSPVYLGSITFFMIFEMAAALSPNIAAQIIFRFLVGLFASPPLVCGGGTISDLFNPLDKTWAFSIYAIIGFGGPMLGPVIGSYVYIWIWRWTDWVTLIMAGIVLVINLCFLPETHPAILQAWKARQLRHLTSDDRYQAQSEISQISFQQRMMHALTRPFVLGMEAIVVAISIYLTIIWTVLFIFLDGYPIIFQQTYKLSQGITNLLFLAMYVGVLCAVPLVYVVYRLTKRDMAKHTTPEGSSKLRAETRQYFAMLGGGWAVPVSLLWMAWTSYPSISIWCPLISTALFGFGLITIFQSAYLYVIDAYEVNAASALGFATITRYVVSGGVTVAGVPFFHNVSHHWVLTILGVFSLFFGTPVPYLLYKYGPQLRERSANAVNKG